MLISKPDGRKYTQPGNILSALSHYLSTIWATTKQEREIKIEIPSRFQDKPGAREREEEKEKV